MVTASTRFFFDEQGNYKVNYVIEKNGVAAADLSLTITGVVLEEKIWELRDFVKGCEEDPVLEVIKDSRKFAIDPKSGAQIYYVAYRVGCVGGIEPLSIKYFAYIGRQKNSLRGEETIVCDGSSFGGEKGPIPDAALKSNPDILKLMLKKWRTFSFRKCGAANN